MNLHLLPTATSVSRPDGRARTVLVDLAHGGSGRSLVLVEPRILDRLAARLHADSLDEQLAAGHPPEASRLLAVRAAMLVSPRQRRRTARYVEGLLERERRSAWAATARVPTARAEVVAATARIHDVAAALRAPRPVDARGVAAVNLLLTRADSPVFSGRRARRRLTTALDEVLAQLGCP